MAKYCLVEAGKGNRFRRWLSATILEPHFTKQRERGRGCQATTSRAAEKLGLVKPWHLRFENLDENQSPPQRADREL